MTFRLKSNFHFIESKGIHKAITYLMNLLVRLCGYVSVVPWSRKFEGRNVIPARSGQQVKENH
jgi:hypothetical protein